MRLSRFRVSVTTNGLGAGSASALDATHGLLYSIRYIKDVVAPYDAGVDFSITHGVHNVWVENDVNADKTVYPRAQMHDTAGVAVNLLSGVPRTTMFINGRRPLAFAVTGGGNTKTGTFEITVMTEIDPAYVCSML